MDNDWIVILIQLLLTVAAFVWFINKDEDRPLEYISLIFGLMIVSICVQQVV